VELALTGEVDLEVEDSAGYGDSQLSPYIYGEETGCQVYKDWDNPLKKRLKRDVECCTNTHGQPDQDLRRRSHYDSWSRLEFRTTTIGLVWTAV
jgi:hypothetical protein